MQVCSNCHYSNRDDARFCEECGVPLEQSCPVCGAAIRSGQKFCHQCGRAVAAPGSPAVVRQTPETYTPTHLAERILRSRQALVGERKHVTVMFADIKDSMRLIAGDDAEDARQVLDAVVGAMMAAVHRY